MKICSKGKGSLSIHDGNDWNRDRLWEIVKSLTEEIRTELLMAAVPELSAVPETTSAEIKLLLSFIASNSFTHDTEDLDLTDITRKLERNRLSESAKALLTPAIPVARLVEDYLNRHPDSEYSARIAQSLGAEYQRITAAGISDPDDVFLQLVRYTTSNDTAGGTKSFWARIGIITHYFQLCDISSDDPSNETSSTRSIAAGRWRGHSRGIAAAHDGNKSMGTGKKTEPNHNF